MVARTLVDAQIEQGAQLLRLLDGAGIPIDAAYWMLASEWSDWWLVLVTPRADELGPDRVSLQIIELSRTLDDYEQLMGRLGIVSPEDRWARAFRERLPNGPAQPNYWLGEFSSREGNLSVLDSYVYRMTPLASRSKNGPARKAPAARNGTRHQLRSGAASAVAAPDPSATPG